MQISPFIIIKSSLLYWNIISLFINSVQKSFQDPRWKGIHYIDVISFYVYMWDETVYNALIKQRNPLHHWVSHFRTIFLTFSSRKSMFWYWTGSFVLIWRFKWFILLEATSIVFYHISIVYHHMISWISQREIGSKWTSQQTIVMLNTLVVLPI